MPPSNSAAFNFLLFHPAICTRFLVRTRQVETCSVTLFFSGDRGVVAAGPATTLGQAHSGQAGCGARHPGTVGQGQGAGSGDSEHTRPRARRGRSALPKIQGD